MMHLIYETCKWGSGRFDGWIIPKAVFTQYRNEVPSLCRIQAKKCRRSFALLEAVGYTHTGEVTQRLEVTLLDGCKMAPGISPVHSPEPPSQSTGQTKTLSQNPHVLYFTQKGLKVFLKESGDANPIHQGNPALVPGLWIFNCLYQKHPHRHLPGEYRIRLLYPTYTGQAVFLDCEENRVTGTCGGIAHFHMQSRHL